MDSSIATGGIMLLVIFIILIAGAVGMWSLASRGYKSMESRDHKKRIERSVRQGYEDENTRRNYARKLLSDYDK